MVATKTISALVAGALLLTLAPTAAAEFAALTEEAYSCSVSTEGPTQCRFACTGGKPIGGSVDVSEGAAGISASCGGGSTGCETRSKCGASGTAQQDATDGLCEISENSFGEDTATGSCYGRKPDKSEPPAGHDCEIEIDALGICVNPDATDQARAVQARLFRANDYVGAGSG